MNREALLKIFTGVHAGAEILLPEGEYSLGTSEACDIILLESTLAPEHCVLVVPPEGDILVRPADAAVSLDSASFTEPFSLPPLKPALAGLLCFAWVERGRSWEGLALPSLLGNANIVGANEERPDAPEKAGQDQPVAEQSGQGSGSPEPGSAEKTEMAPPPSRARKLTRTALLALGLLLLAGLTLWFRPGGFSEPDTARLAEDLAGAGFPYLSVGARNGMVVVSGLVREQTQFEAVREISARQPYQVQVVVRTVEQFIRMARSTLAAHAVFPQLMVDDHEAVLHGYVRDSLVDRAALSWLRTSLPNLTPLRSAMLTRKEVAPVLQSALIKAGLISKVGINWQPGIVELDGRLSSQERERLLAVMSEVRNSLRCPVAFQITGSGSEEQIYLGELPRLEDATVTVLAKAEPGTAFAQGTVRMPEGAAESAVAAFSNPMSGEEAREAGPAAGPGGALRPFGDGVSLRSVASLEGQRAGHAAAPFITTSDGRLYFIGGILPGGHTLVGIHHDRLELLKNDKTTTYKLQGW